MNIKQDNPEKLTLKSSAATGTKLGLRSNKEAGGKLRTDIRSYSSPRQNDRRISNPEPFAVKQDSKLTDIERKIRRDIALRNASRIGESASSALPEISNTSNASSARSKELPLESAAPAVNEHISNEIAVAPPRLESEGPSIEQRNQPPAAAIQESQAISEAPHAPPEAQASAPAPSRPPITYDNNRSGNNFARQTRPSYRDEYDPRFKRDSRGYSTESTHNNRLPPAAAPRPATGDPATATARPNITNSFTMPSQSAGFRPGQKVEYRVPESSGYYRHRQEFSGTRQDRSDEQRSRRPENSDLQRPGAPRTDYNNSPRTFSTNSEGGAAPSIGVRYSDGRPRTSAPTGGYEGNNYRGGDQPRTGERPAGYEGNNYRSGDQPRTGERPAFGNSERPAFGNTAGQPLRERTFNSRYNTTTTGPEGARTPRPEGSGAGYAQNPRPPFVARRPAGAPPFGGPPRSDFSPGGGPGRFAPPSILGEPTPSRGAVNFPPRPSVKVDDKKSPRSLEERRRVSSKPDPDSRRRNPLSTGDGDGETQVEYVRPPARRVRAGSGAKSVRAEQAKTISIKEADSTTVAQLAYSLAEKVSDVTKVITLLTGRRYTPNEILEPLLLIDIVERMGHHCELIGIKDIEAETYLETLKAPSSPRPPIVTVMGHVDHGKTSLLDAIRNADVASTEAGGITQHIGAYQITTKSNHKITFIDTPGHAAFTAMRARGANITDIVVLVVAADDGIMEQTVEAINHAKAANVPIIVAINKIDKGNADIDRVKRELLQHELISEDMGGDIIMVPVSATKRTNIDELLEMILLTAEMLELKSPLDAKSNGVVIEAKMEQGRGAIATIIVKNGTLKNGDYIVAGLTYGKVRAMYDHNMKKLTDASPSTPLELMGLNEIPKAGDKFIVLGSEKAARELIDEKLRKIEKSEQVQKFDISNMFATSDKVSLAFIVKCDVDGSVAVINNYLQKLADDRLDVKIIHSAVGAVLESDISLAEASNAWIIAFNIRVPAKIMTLATSKKIKIVSHSIIYKVFDDLTLMVKGLFKPEMTEKYLGAVQVRQTFFVSKAGTICGSYVTDGSIKRGAIAKLYRDSKLVHQGTIKTLKRFKEDVKLVKTNFECGLQLENYNDVKVGDVIEAYELQEIGTDTAGGATSSEKR